MKLISSNAYWGAVFLGLLFSPFPASIGLIVVAFVIAVGQMAFDESNESQKGQNDGDDSGG